MTREQFISHVEGTQKSLRRFLVALCCGDSALADDVAQETYIKAYLSCDGFNNPEKFNAWIFRIAHNTFLNILRSRRVTVDYDNALDIAAHDKADSVFAYEELYHALAKLPDKERMSILLFYMENYSVKEISDILESSQDAIKQQLSRGRNHLRGLLSSKKT